MQELLVDSGIGVDLVVDCDDVGMTFGDISDLLPGSPASWNSFLGVGSSSSVADFDFCPSFPQQDSPVSSRPSAFVCSGGTEYWNVRGSGQQVPMAMTMVQKVNRKRTSVDGRGRPRMRPTSTTESRHQYVDVERSSGDGMSMSNGTYDLQKAPLAATKSLNFSLSGSTF